MVMSGVAYDVVPGDSISAHMTRRMPEVTDITLYFKALGNSLQSASKETSKTLMEAVGAGIKVRRDGVIKALPFKADSQWVGFGVYGKTKVAGLPCGDISTTFHTTGTTNITT
ncbi:hypothetical protein A9Q96_08865 [Rhodobacterales bacterium 52_120_T64]|nr:hypothetical protein A9Q96_08865 [Rhodobacterales bacterium 52_120_T64]